MINKDSLKNVVNSKKERDNMVDAAARDRVADNGLICAYMEIYPKGIRYGIWVMFKDGVRFECDNRERCITEFCSLAKYDTSWEWLMPVVEKIRKEKWNTHQVYFIMHNDKVEVYTSAFEDGFYFKVDGSGISSVYEAVVKYLEL